MCTVLLPLGVNTIAVKYIISYIWPPQNSTKAYMFWFKKDIKALVVEWFQQLQKRYISCCVIGMPVGTL
jgi:hypothetical protein